MVYLATPWRDLAWFCVLAEYGSERLARDEISRKGFTVFAPTIFKPATRARRNAVGAIIPAKPAGSAPLFGRYQFVQFRRSDPWEDIRGLPGVEGILGTAPDSPVPISNHIIDVIRLMCDANGCFHEKGEVPNSLVGKLLRLLEGPFSSFEGICDWAEDGEARVTITAFNRPCSVTVEQTAVEAV